MSKRPYRRPDDPVLGQLYDVAMDAADAPVGADRAPGLITAVPTLAELRRTPGDVAGQAGPPAITVAGTQSPGDGGGDTYVWRPGSTQADNNGDNTGGAGIVAVVGIDRGRWVRASVTAKTAALDVFTATKNGLAPLSGGGTAKFLRADGTWATPPAPTGLTLLRRSILTSGTSLAKATGCTFATARGVGGGGGGGGVGNSVVQAAGGGAAGSYWEFSTSTIPATWAYAIGAGGSAGANTGGNGGAGGDTTFSDGATTVTAHGGAGGTGDPSGAGPKAVAGGAPTAVSTNGTVNSGGVPGFPALLLSASLSGTSGNGGSTAFGAGGAARVNASAAGRDATGFGGGGGGAMTSGGGLIGGVGAPGLIELEEWG